MRLQHNQTVESQEKGAAKYLPLFDYFQNALLSARKLPLTVAKRHELAEQISNQRHYAIGLIKTP